MFHGLRAPPISIEAYLVRIAKYAKCSPACFAHSMVHMLKLAQQDPSFAPTRLNVHRLVLTGVLISAKFLDDRYFNNAFYAKVCRHADCVCPGGGVALLLPGWLDPGYAWCMWAAPREGAAGMMLKVGLFVLSWLLLDRYLLL